MDAKKYGRTYHFPFSPGTTSDDRIQHEFWNHICSMPAIVHTEKLDGENNCLNQYGVFARSHATTTVSPWTARLREHWQLIKNDLGDIELFGENLYAIHSIEYSRLENYYYVFAVREADRWLSWEEVCFYATYFDFPTVPILQVVENPFDMGIQAFTDQVISLAREESVLLSRDILTEQSCSREGIVTRNINSFPCNELGSNVFKYVRKGHVKTDVHWTRNWRRARLWYEHKI